MNASGDQCYQPILVDGQLAIWWCCDEEREEAEERVRRLRANT